MKCGDCVVCAVDVDEGAGDVYPGEFDGEV